MHSVVFNVSYGIETIFSDFFYFVNFILVLSSFSLFSVIIGQTFFHIGYKLLFVSDFKRNWLPDFCTLSFDTKIGDLCA